MIFSFFWCRGGGTSPFLFQGATVSKHQMVLGALHTWTATKFAFNKSDLVWFKTLSYAGSCLQGLWGKREREGKKWREKEKKVLMRLCSTFWVLPVIVDIDATTVPSGSRYMVTDCLTGPITALNPNLCSQSEYGGHVRPVVKPISWQGLSLLLCHP